MSRPTSQQETVPEPIPLTTMGDTSSAIQFSIAEEIPRSPAPLTASSLIRLNSDNAIIRPTTEEGVPLETSAYPIASSPRNDTKPLYPQTTNAVVYDMSSFQMPPPPPQQSKLPDNVLQASTHGVGIRNDIVPGGSGPFYFTAMTVNPIHNESPPPPPNFESPLDEGAPPPPPLVGAPRASLVPSGDSVPPPPFSS